MIDFRIKQLFFDRQRVIGAAAKATLRVLSKFGAYVRTSMRSSIRSGGKKNKVSIAGAPPRSHVGLLKDGIFFGYDEASKTVVIGPVLVSAKGRANGKTVPQTLEEGGVITIVSKNGRTRQANIDPRPYARPALEANLPRLPAMWANSIKE